MEQIDAATLRQMIISAANNIQNNRKEVNQLNVFPVPDGDTGTNMSLTILSSVKEMINDDSSEVGIVAEKAASALLRGARGNSGVILSILFRGFSKSLKGLVTADSKQFAQGWKTGIDSAYKSVMKPAEGTILTVARLAFEHGVEIAERKRDVVEVLDEIIEVAKETLDKTPDLLPVLKQANVVDAGGKGLVIILEGASYYLKNHQVIESSKSIEGAKETAQSADFSAFDTESIKFSYCTEYIVKRNNNDNPQLLRGYLESIGDCVVVVDDEEIIKIHVHTNNPGKALERGLSFGTLTSIKVENMKEQHTQLESYEQNQHEPMPDADSNKSSEPQKKYGFVVISAGDGIAELFSDLGADKIVSGGQTMNPSTEDILSAIEKVQAESVFVLPNNKNIIMAAEQAVPLSSKNVIVIPTKTIPQGVTALLNFDESAGIDTNKSNMINAIAKTKTGQITFAARDSAFDGKDIKEGQILGLLENRLYSTDLDLNDTLMALAEKLVEENGELLTIYYGKEITKEQAEDAAQSLRKKFGDRCEITVVYGGQPVYYYIISAE